MTEENKEINPKLKYNLILIGDMGVGKTTLFNKIIYDKFVENTTTTMKPEAKSIPNLDNEHAELVLVDTPGVEKYKDIFKNTYKESDAALVLYDVTNEESFKNMDECIGYINNCIEDEDKETYTYFLLGTKSDLLNENGFERKIQIDDVELKCKNTKNMKLIGEISSKNSIKEIKEIINFNEILETIHKKRKNKKPKNISIRKNSPKNPSEKEKKKNKCCGCF